MTRKFLFERSVEITPAFDQRKQGYGIHGCDLIMNLKGKKGIVYLALSTNWHLPNVTKEMVSSVAMGKNSEIDIDIRFLPHPIELGYHSPVPVDGFTEPTRLYCHHLPGITPCYCSSGCLAAEEPFKILIEKGSEAVWKFLEEYYIRIFGDVENDL